MFGIGFTEILLILIVALVIIGPEKLPELAKTIGKAFNEFKRTSNDIKRTIEGVASPSSPEHASVDPSVAVSEESVPSPPSSPLGMDREEEVEPEEKPKKRASRKSAVKPRRVQKKKTAAKGSKKKPKGEGES